MVQALIVAAGNSQRYGSNKLLAPLPNGKPLVQVVVQNLKVAVNNISAVIQPNDVELMELFNQEEVTTIPCANSTSGMGHSIACGISNTSDAVGWVIVLADMPFINQSTYIAVTNSLKQGAIIALPTYNNKRGHPVGFSAELYKELIALRGDTGAQVLLNNHSSEITKINCNDPAIHIDIDTPKELIAYSKQFDVA